MTELKKCITDNKFYCHGSNDEYYMKKIPCPNNL